MKSFPKNKNVRMDICVKKKKQFFKALFKAIEGGNSFSIIKVIGKITMFHKKKFDINKSRIAVLKSLRSIGFDIIEK